MMQDLSRTAAGVQFVGVSKTYPTGLTAIAHLDLDIRPGEFLTLLGPSGSGKTTALNLLAGFQSPTSGQILVDGKDIGALPPHKRDIGVVFQHYALFPHLTVRENIGYPLKQRGETVQFPGVHCLPKRALLSASLCRGEAGCAGKSV